MDQANTIFLAPTGTTAKACEGLTMLPGRFAVAMDPEREQSNGVLLPDDVQGRLRPDTGTVIAVGAGCPLRVGQRVAVRPYDGMWLTDEQSNALGYEQVRLYGIWGDEDGCERCPYWEQCPITFEDGEPFPNGELVMLRREVREGMETARPIYTDFATVIATGELVEPGLVSQRVFYKADDLIEFHFHEDKAVCLVPQDCVKAIIE